MSSTHLAISDNVREDEKGYEEQDGKRQTPYKLQMGAGHRQYCWEQQSRANVERLQDWPTRTHKGSIPAKARNRDILGKFNYWLHPWRLHPLFPGVSLTMHFT
jgi:hypothetical protein